MGSRSLTVSLVVVVRLAVVHMQQMFEQFDTDKSGELEWEEFWTILSSLELGLSDEEIAEWQKVGPATLEFIVHVLVVVARTQRC